MEMSAIIKVKNRTNWLVTFITTLALIILLFIILIVIPLGSAEKTYLLSALSYILNVIPFIAFFILFFYVWLWNTFGKVILNIEPDSITITYKNKLFTKPKTFDKQEITKIKTIDLRMEKYKFGVRYHFSWIGATSSVVLADRNGETRIVDWITEKEADEITDKIKKVWY
ncbi:hypothetical protein QWZ06_02930 [Chryseobacterium tructae]|uniref:DUF304 domain-containing protein n=1 Tax=Chryseobacterium tructae TaxID=1037380 RepID=A0ABV7XUW9_9FLAO|nr:hypothetical protein [Chryseobacterium tructae]MDN3691285.1 hypothetical protein [Chryseobacterium tructae]